MINKLYAVCLLVQNFEKSLEFYRDQLGLTVNSTDGLYADFKLGDTLLGIFQKNEAVSMFAPGYMNSGGGCVLAYQVDDVEKSCLLLKEKGIEIFEGPKKTSWGQSVAYFKDPDNTIWELTT